jgi:hypothetical protein
VTSEETVQVTLTRREAEALIYSYDINEYPVSNPLGREGTELLDAAEAKLRAAIGMPPTP